MSSGKIRWRVCDPISWDEGEEEGEEEEEEEEKYDTVKLCYFGNN